MFEGLLKQSTNIRDLKDNSYSREVSQKIYKKLKASWHELSYINFYVHQKDVERIGTIYDEHN